MYDGIRRYKELMGKNPGLFGNYEGFPKIMGVETMEGYAANHPGEAMGVAFESPYSILLRDVVAAPDGAEYAFERRLPARTIASSGGDVRVCGSVVCARAGEAYVLVKVRRHALRSHRKGGHVSVEFPRGFCGENDADALQGALRELSEELGVIATATESLGVCIPDGGAGLWCAELFVVEIDGIPMALTAGAEVEGISGYVAMSRAELLAAVANGEIEDGYTLACVARLLAREAVRGASDA